ncbi:selenophosphate synthase [Cognatiyoonia koreensis]|uniref:Selenophosphate synthase n=1 Tax=Cognatiyoonia koreensis TaxID=364200 RepID=A0A1I0RVL9_9RHOB|nr:selenide, water dikinase SelD [Cognatiyoonia koreensis]SEW45474.1 selenophosphate synthase [Cognatiyoonia koreensis]
MHSRIPLTRDLVLVGGGHTHALILRKWGMNPLPGVRLTVINPGATAPYSGMLPGFVAGHYTRAELDIDLVQLARFAEARIINGAVNGIDLKAKTISVPGRPPISYDVAAIDIGITSEMPKLPGFAEYGVPAKPLGVFASRWDSFRSTASDPHVAVIGGGVAGAELAMAMAHALRARGQTPDIHLLDRGKVLAVLGDTARQKMKSALAANGVTIHEDASAVAVHSDGVECEGGTVVPSDFTVGAAGAKPHDWQSDIGLQMHEGFIWTDAHLQTSDPAIFAVGDCAHFSADPRPKAGVYAVRQAPVHFDNLRAALSGGTLRSYKPQKDYLKLISLGDKKALAEKFGTAMAGGLLWKWKDHIDRKFMNQFENLQMMDQPDLPLTIADGVRDALGDKPMCGGCGAKVGRTALRSALKSLPDHSRDDVVTVTGDDAALLRMGSIGQVISTDHLRSFTNDPVMMARIAAVHALGDIWAMGAKPQAATATIILPRTSPELQQRMLDEIMAAAAEIMGKAGAAIVGGHTSLGDEMTIGFTVTGLCDKPITIAGGKAGNALILTKPLGSGVIMAAEMAGKAAGADVIGALETMCADQAKASEILTEAHAMTDVTGFGLAGHLAGLCEASNAGAVVALGDVPLMQGARALSEDGIKSTLYGDNRSGAGSIFGADGPVADLLFDPQTAGGLLASVPAERSQQILARLKKAGYEDAAIIGHLTEQTGTIKVQ